MLDQRIEALLLSNSGQFVSEIVRLYSLDELDERNATYQTAEYCPEFIAIGDDSGGRAIVCHKSAEGPIYIVDHGSMAPNDFEEIASNLKEWASNDYSLNT
jgi:hypothetical protein